VERTPLVAIDDLLDVSSVENQGLARKTEL